MDADQPDPIDTATLTFLTITTRLSFRPAFNAGDGPNTAFSLIRWINTRGEKRPWSDVSTAMVAA